MVKVPKFNTRYSYKKVPGLLFDPENNEKDVSLTEQCFAYECDINNIVKMQVPTSVNQKTPLFNTVFSPDLYEKSLNVIAEASSKFEELPSELRTRFENDPKKLLEFLSDDKNYDEAVKLGLVKRKLSDDLKPINPSKNPVDVTTKPSGDVVNPTSPD